MVFLSRFRRSISYRLLLYILLFSGLVTLVITAVQLFIDYRQDIREINRGFSSIRESYLKSLTSAVWVFNEELIRAQLEGMYQLRDIVYVSVFDQGKTIATAGRPVEEHAISREFPLMYSYKGVDRRIGVLRVTADLQGVYRRLRDKVLVILIAQGAKTFLVSLFMLLIFQRLVNRHLKRIEGYLGDIRLDRDRPPLRLSRGKSPVSEEDELSRLVDRINLLLGELRRSYARVEGELVRRREAEQALKKSEGSLRSLLQAAPIGIGLLQGRSIRWSNGQLSRMTGYPQKAITGMDPRRLYEEDSEYRRIGRVLRSAIDQDGLARAETRWRRRDGSALDVLLIFSKLESADLSAQLIFTATDITEQRRTRTELESRSRELGQVNTALRERNRFIEVILDHLPIGLGVNAADDGQVHYLNRQFESIYGWSRSDLTDVDAFFDCVFPDPDTRERMRTRILGDIAAGDPERMKWQNLQITTRTGEERRVDAINIPLFEQNLMISTAQDVTEKVLTEAELNRYREHLEHLVEERTAALQEANTELSQYAYVVSHDLKVPLRAIHNYVDFLHEDLGGRLEPELQEYLDEMRNAVQQGEKLVDDLLVLSRIGKKGDSPNRLETGVFLRDLAESLKLKAEVFFQGGEWPVLEVDEVLFRQIFSNLMVNAVKFNQSPQKRVELGVFSGKGGSEFHISDNGIGISPAYTDRIFRVFERLHTPEEYEGTGIGLAIVKKAVAKLGGRVRLESLPGRGSTFYVTLPNQSTLFSRNGEPHA